MSPHEQCKRVSKIYLKLKGMPMQTNEHKELMAAAKFYQSGIVSEHLKILGLCKWKKMALPKHSVKASAPWEEIKCKVSCLSGKSIGSRIKFRRHTQRAPELSVNTGGIKLPWRKKNWASSWHGKTRDLIKAMVFLFSSSLLKICSLQPSPKVN